MLQGIVILRLQGLGRRLGQNSLGTLVEQLQRSMIMGIVDRFKRNAFLKGDTIYWTDESGEERVGTVIDSFTSNQQDPVIDIRDENGNRMTIDKYNQPRKHAMRTAELEKEYERRWDLNSLPEGLGEPSIIKQGMLAEGEDGYARIREQDGKYTMTAKYFPSHDEAETEISKEIFETLWPHVDKQQVKKRYKYHAGDDHDWVIDEIDDGTIVAEVETSRKNGKVEVPEEFDVKEERTYD